MSLSEPSIKDLCVPHRQSRCAWRTADLFVGDAADKADTIPRLLACACTQLFSVVNSASSHRWKRRASVTDQQHRHFLVSDRYARAPHTAVHRSAAILVQIGRYVRGSMGGVTRRPVRHLRRNQHAPDRSLGGQPVGAAITWRRSSSWLKYTVHTSAAKGGRVPATRPRAPHSGRRSVHLPYDTAKGCKTARKLVVPAPTMPCAQCSPRVRSNPANGFALLREDTAGTGDAGSGGSTRWHPRP